jgi:hypothetical protein
MRWVVCGLVVLAAGCGSDGGNGTVADVSGGKDAGKDFVIPLDIPEFKFDLWDGNEDSDLQGDGTQIPDHWTADGEEGRFDPDLPGDKKGDGACVPQCTNTDGSEVECGPDGCGSLCGYCGYGEQCVTTDVSRGECLPTCIPKCAGKQCGPDGCYGQCPPGCDGGFKCGEDQKCYPDCNHDVNCAGKQCGTDGCGGQCGYCGAGFVCEGSTGQCITDPCAGLGTKGKCQGQTLQECVNGQVKETMCSSLGADWYCKWDALAQKYVCGQGCVPQCQFGDGSAKECGDDGCGGQCGGCPNGWGCEASICIPEVGGACGWITPTGTCINNVLWFCGGNALYAQNCPSQGMMCQYDHQAAKFQCK